MNEVALCSGERAALLENVHRVRDGRAPELCNRKPCFDRLRVRRSRSRCSRSHFIEPERRFKLKRKKCHAIVAARKRSDTVGEFAGLAEISTYAGKSACIVASIRTETGSLSFLAQP
jgi:hypothetical protein